MYHLACTQIMFWAVTTSVYQVLMMQYNIQKLKHNPGIFENYEYG